MDNTETINILSLCTGYGGLELGLARALEGIFRVVAVEVEAFALANLAAKAHAGRLAVEAMWPDVKTFPAERFRGCFDFVLAGYPCQPFSVAGKQKGESDPRHLWPHIEAILQAVRPVWFFGENVPGHLAIGFPSVYCKLRNLGYSVEAGLFTAAECGAPHRRERLFILAHDTSFGYRRRFSGISGDINRIQKSESARQQIERSNCRSNELADTEHKGPQGKGYSIAKRGDVTSSDLGYFSSIWPARPGQPQYEWERPRVIMGDTGKEQAGRLSLPEKRVEKRKTGKPGKELGDTRKRRREQSAKKIQTGRKAVDHAGKGQAQSRMGGAANGTSSRVDRLRLLGNGVVPQCAELAFRTLYEKF